MYYYLTCCKKHAVSRSKNFNFKPIKNYTYYVAAFKDNDIYETIDIDKRMAFDIKTAKKIQRLFSSFKINIEK